MRRRVVSMFGGLVIALSLLGMAQAPAPPTNVHVEANLVSNPIAASRLPGGVTTVPNPIWAATGVVGGIPSDGWNNCTTASCLTLCPNVTTTGSPSCFGGSMTEATIESAVGGATDNTRVWMPAGVVTTGGPTLSNSKTVLKGQGASATVLKINAQADSTCHVGSFGQLFNVCSGGANIGVDSPDNTATWTAASYAAGQTTITLSARTNLRVGSPIWLDQLDDFDGHIDTSEGYPGAGDVVMGEWNGGATFSRSGRSMDEGHIVTACGTSTDGALCTSNTITIDNGLFMPTWRAAQTPGAWWASDSSRVDFIGVEDFTIDSNGDTAAPLVFINGTNVWARGVRLLVADATGQGARLIPPVNCIHCEFRENYLSGPESSQVINNYGFAPILMSQSRFENNIIAGSVNPIVTNGSTFGNVFAYNVVEGQSISTEQANLIEHSIGGMNLYEGNQFGNISFDNIAAVWYFDTVLRNHFDGTTRNTLPTAGEAQAGMNILSVHRFYNLLGNVLGSSTYTVYERDCTSSCGSAYQNAVFGIGWEGTNGPAQAATDNDPRTKTTLFRWGNWDNVTSSDDNGANDSTGLRWVSGEVPSGITNFSNPVPSTQTVPTSLFRSSIPSYFGARAWPPIGPGVSNSDITTRTGGHANEIPAKDCFDDTASDTTNYNGSSPAIKAFDRVACYGA